MRKILFFFLTFITCICFSQSIYNSQQIGQTGRNQNVSRGFWVKSDTALFTSLVWVPLGAAAGNVLTSDAAGFATWQPTTNTAWGLTGNSGTTPSTNFIGTADATDFVLKTNGIGRGRFGSDGTLNIQSQLSSNLSALIRYTNNYFGFGIPALLLGDSTSDGFNGVTVIDGTLLGIGKNTGSVGFTSPDQSKYSRIVWTNKGDTSVISLQATRGDTNVVLNNDAKYLLNYEITIAGHELRFVLPSDTAPVGYHLAVTTNFGDGGIQMGFVRSDSLNSFQLVDGAQGAGKVLTSDADGNATWGNQILTDTATLDFGVITAHDQEILTVTITGAVLSDVVTLGIPQSTMSTEKLSFNAWVSSADTVSIKCYNFDGANIDPASGLFKIKVFK